MEETHGAEHAPDGSPVGLYRRLRPGIEPALIHSVAPAGCEILELGCGAGRITHALLELGHPVVAVDVSAEMLASVRGARTVHADIESLALGQEFQCVVLASDLVNVPDEYRRRARLQTCERHLAREGVLVIERLAPAWVESAKPGTVAQGDMTQHLRRVSYDPASRLVSAHVDYQIGSERWSHEFVAAALTDEELEAELQRAGLVLAQWLDQGHWWLTATRSSPL